MIIRNFIFKEWYKSFFGAFSVLFLLVSATNLISNFLRRTVTSEEVIIHYLLGIPNWFSKIFPVSCLMATLFTIRRLKGKNELMAILASGYTYKNFMGVIFFSTFVVVVVQYANVSYLGPYFKSLRHEWMPDSGNKFSSTKSKGLITSIASSGKIWYKGDGFFLSFKGHDKKAQELSNLSLYYFKDDYSPKKILMAEKAKMILETKSDWELKEVEEYVGLFKKDFTESSHREKKKLSLSNSHQVVGQIIADITTLPLWALFSYVENIKKTGIDVSEYETLFYEKVQSGPLCLIFSMIPISGLYRPNRRESNFGKNVAFIFVFILFYWFAQSFLTALGGAGKISPFWAIFSLPILFSLYIIIFIAVNRKIR